MSSYRRFQYGSYKPNNYRINNNNNNNNNSNSTIESISNNFFNNSNNNYQKDAFRAKLDYQHSRLTGDHINLIRNTSNHKIKNSMNHSNSTNRLLGNKNNKSVYSNNLLKNYGNNINNNVNYINNNNNFNSGNLNNNIINNLLLNSNNNNNNNNKSLNVINNNNNNINSINNNSKIFSKLGNNIINNNNNNTINNINSKKMKFNLKEKKLNKNNSISSTSGLENVLEDLMKMTKEKTINYNNNNKENINNININKQNNFDINNNNNNFNTNNFNNFNNFNNNKNKENLEKFTFIACENIEFHYKLWTLFFLMEIHSENKNSLHNTIKKIINLLDSNFNKIEEKLNENINLEIFNNENLNNAYLKILKIYLVLIVYIKFLLIDFNFEMTIKSNIKRLISSINEQFLTLISTQIFPNFSQNLQNNTNIFSILKQNKNCEKMDNEFLESFTKIIKNKHIKKTKENPNIFALNLINKHLELVISTIKQFSNNFFKIGYFKPIHSICIEIFRLIDQLSLNNIINSVIIGMLYYITHNNPEKKKTSISLSNSNVLSALGFINIPSPFLPSLKNIIKYTLVLDLDETLVHYFYTPSGGTFLIRPFCYHFLYEMSKLFEIVIFTAAMKDYADSILDVLDPEKKYIKFRLYRSHTSISGMNFVKDLNKLGRDLNKVVIIDNLADNFKLQQNNGIQCGTWIEDMKDTQLMDIEGILKEIVKDDPEDLRVGIKKINGEIKKKIKRNILNPFKGLDVGKILKE